MPPSSCHDSTDPRLVGDPVDTSKGAVVDDTLDFRLTGPLELHWLRHYDSSLSHRRFALGWGHTHDFDRTLRFDTDGISYHPPLDRVIGFPPLLKDGDEFGREGHVLRRITLLRYRVYHHGEPAMEFEFRKPQERARLKRLFKGRAEIMFRYSADGRWESIFDSAGRTLQVVEEPDGRIRNATLLHRSENPGQPEKPPFLLVGYDYDQQGNLIAARDASGYRFTCAYDLQNRMVRRTGRKGFSFCFKYDLQGRCVKSSGDDGMNQVTLEYNIPGRVTKVTRADGGVWTYLFDEAGGLLQVLDPLGGVQQFLKDKTGRVTSELDPNGNATSIVYDSAGCPVAKITPTEHRLPLPEDPNAPNPRVHRVAANPAEYEFGRLLRLDQITLPTSEQAAVLPLSREAQSLVVTRPQEPDPKEEWRSFEARPLGPRWWPEPKQGRIFDDQGYLVAQRDHWGRRRQWFYDPSGNMAEFIDFDGGKWTYALGSWHLRLAETNPLDSAVRFTYHPSAELATCTDAGGTRSEYSYDLKDHLVEVRRHGVVRDKYTRDAVGNLVAKHAGDGRLLLQFEIGPGNLPVKRTLASGDEHNFRYDEKGRYLVVATKKDEVRFSYDALGNRVSDKRNGRGVEHQFSGWRMPRKSVFFERFIVHYERSPDCVLVITDPSGKQHRVQMHSHGLVERRFSNGSSEWAQYDSLGRCLFKHTKRVNSRAWNRIYHWSGEGELRRIQDNQNGETRHEYDAAHRLRRRILPDGRVENYELDLADNLVRQPGLDKVFLQEGNRLHSVNGLNVEYNDRNQISVRQAPNGKVLYFYDSRDQLTRVETPQGTWTAEYDALGRRTRKTWSGQTTEYYWYDDQLIAEVHSDGRLRLYVYADPLAITPLLFLDYASVEAPPESCRRHFVFSDQIGTPCMVEDESGAEAWRAQVEPYGQAQVSPGANIAFNLRFPGHYQDAEIGLNYNRFRYYDPYLGRYLQSDPWGIAGGYNLYAYRPNPLLQVDVLGLGDKGVKPGEPCKDDEEGIKPPPGFPTEEEVRRTLPAFDGKTTYGVLVTNEGDVEPLVSGTRPPGYENYESAAHVEGQAAIYIRENNSTGGVVYHNNTNGTCGYCNGHVSTLLPEGAQMLVVPPEGAKANNSRATAEPTIYTGNSNTPKQPK